MLKKFVRRVLIVSVVASAVLATGVLPASAKRAKCGAIPSPTDPNTYIVVCSTNRP